MHSPIYLILLFLAVLRTTTATCTSSWATNVEEVPSSAGWLPPDGNPAFSIRLIEGHHTIDTILVCNNTVGLSYTSFNTELNTCNNILADDGGEILSARIAIYFSGAPGVNGVNIYWQETETPNGCKVSAGNEVMTWCNEGVEVYWCLSSSTGARFFEVF